MRTSITATSGLWALTLRSRSSASPAWPATSKPDSSSRRARPSRNSTESSAITTRSGSITRPLNGYLGAESRAGPRRRVDPQPPVEGGDPVGEPAEARPVGRIGAADAVVGDLHDGRPDR